MMVTREQIVATLSALNAAENDRPHSTVENTSLRIDALMAENVSGSRNGVPVADRAAEREVERKAFGNLVDYNRTFELMIVDPPYACITWTIRGTFNGEPIAAPGCSNFEFRDDGRILRYWMYFNPADFTYRS